MMDFKAGDIGLSTSNAIASKVIKFFTSWLTKNARRSHAWTMVRPPLLVEAVGKTVINNLKKYDKLPYEIYRIPLTEDERNDLEIGMYRQIRRAYGYFKLPLFALDAICTKAFSFFGRKKPIFFFTKYFGITNIPVCSQLVVWGLYKFTSYRLKDEFGNIVSWKIVSPDYLEDLLKLPINEATLIYRNKP